MGEGAAFSEGGQEYVGCVLERSRCHAVAEEHDVGPDCRENLRDLTVGRSLAEPQATSVGDTGEWAALPSRQACSAVKGVRGSALRVAVRKVQDREGAVALILWCGGRCIVVHSPSLYQASLFSERL